MSRGAIALFVPHLGCTHRCVFCDQRQISGTLTPPTPKDVEDAVALALSRGGKADGLEIAFFGGSFTAVEEAYRLSLLETAARLVRAHGLAGIRISTRPDCLPEEVIRQLKTYGVSMVELGVQSMDDGVLRESGRGHTAGDTLRAVERLRAAGMPFGAQLMLGLPGSDWERERSTAEAVVDLAPACVRIYPLLVLKHTPLEALWRQGRYRPLTLDEAVWRTARLLSLFEEKRIPVIRAGLHDGPDLKNGVLAGPYHPAFRQKCEGLRVREDILKKLAGHSACTVSVSPRRVDDVVGHQKENLTHFQNLGLHVTIRVTDEIEGYRVSVKE